MHPYLILDPEPVHCLCMILAYVAAWIQYTNFTNTNMARINKDDRAEHCVVILSDTRRLV